MSLISWYLILFPILMLTYRVSLMFVPFLYLFFLLIGSGTSSLSISKKTLRGVLPILALLSLILFSTIWSINPKETLISFFYLYIYIFIFLLSYYYFNVKKETLLKKVVKYLPLATLASLIFFSVTYGGVRVSKLDLGDSASKLSAFSNHASSTVILLIPLLLAYMKITKGGYLYLFSLFSAISVVLLSQSRASISLLVFILFLSIFLFNPNARKLLKNILLYVFIAIATLFPLSQLEVTNNILEPIVHRFEQSQISSSIADVLTKEPSKEDDDFGRAIMYYEGVNLIKEHYVLGIGYNSFKYYLDDRYGLEIISHNLFITAWGELGLLGLLLIIFIIWQTFKKPWQARKAAIKRGDSYYMFLYSGILISIIVAWLNFMTRPQFNNPIFWFLLAYIYSIKRYSHHD